MALAPSPAVLRAADVLHHLAANPSDRFTVSELARDLAIPRATCDTLLLALANRGLVRRDAARRYELGPACTVLGDAARVANPALRGAEHHAEELARSLGAVTAVGISDGIETRVVAVFDHGPPLGFRARAGEAIELAPPFGSPFVAWEDEEAVASWLGRADPPLSRREVSAYRAALEAVRRRGYSVTLVTPRQPALIDALARPGRRAREEVARQMAHTQYLAAEVEGAEHLRVAQVSAPVFDAEGRVAASIMLLGTAHELTAGEVAELGRRVRDAANAASVRP